MGNIGYKFKSSNNPISVRHIFKFRLIQIEGIMKIGYVFHRDLAFLKDVKFWTLAITIFGVGFCLAITIFSYIFNVDGYRQTALVTTNWLPSIEELSKMRLELNEGRRAEAFIMFGGSCAPKSCAAAAQDRRTAIIALESNYGKSLISSAEEELLFQTYVLQRNIYFAAQDELLKNPNAQLENKNLFLSDSASIYADVLKTINALNDFNYAEAKSAQRVIDEKFSQAHSFLICLIFMLATMLAVLFLRVVFLMTSQSDD